MNQSWMLERNITCLREGKDRCVENACGKGCVCRGVEEEGIIYKIIYKFRFELSCYCRDDSELPFFLLGWAVQRSRVSLIVDLH